MRNYTHFSNIFATLHKRFTYILPTLFFCCAYYPFTIVGAGSAALFKHFSYIFTSLFCICTFYQHFAHIVLTPRRNPSLLGVVAELNALDVQVQKLVHTMRGLPTGQQKLIAEQFKHLTAHAQELFQISSRKTKKKTQGEGSKRKKSKTKKKHQGDGSKRKKSKKEEHSPVSPAKKNDPPASSASSPLRRSPRLQVI